MKPICRELREAFRKNEAVCARVLNLFHVLSNKGRFRIACLLARGEFCVNEIAEVVSDGRTANISPHLKILALSGVVERRREHQRIFYRIKDRGVGRLIQYLQDQFMDGGKK